MKTLSKKLVYLLLILVVTSCVNKQKVNYIQELDEKDLPNTYMNIRTEKKIEVYDKLYINVYNIDPNVSGLFQERNSFSQNVNLISYTVNDKGFIDFPFVGNVKLQGLTLAEAKIKLEIEFNRYMPNSSIILRYVGNQITVIGEVNRQGEYPFYDDKINIFQALSFAGGIGDFGDKSLVKIIREIDGEINIYEIDMSKKDIVESPFYYLNPNDILVVRPIRAKYRTYRDFSILMLGLTTITALSSFMSVYYSNFK